GPRKLQDDMPLAIAPRGDLRRRVRLVHGHDQRAGERLALVEKRHGKFADGGSACRNDLQRQPQRAVEPRDGAAAGHDERLGAARVDLLARFPALAPAGALLRDLLQPFVGEVLLEFLRLELDGRAAAAVREYVESRLFEPCEAGGIRSGEPGNGRLDRRSRRDEAHDFPVVARDGIAVEVLPHAQRDLDLRGGRRPEARRLDPEVVRSKRRRREERHEARGWKGAPAHQTARDRFKYSASFSRSTLPPERMTPTRCPEKSALRWRTAAAPATPDG